jgi:cyanophycin synthetase
MAHAIPAPARGPVRLEELRVLDGPNLYFTRPAVKLTVAVPGWIDAPDERIGQAVRRSQLPSQQVAASASAVRAGTAGSDQRRRFVARLAAHVVRSLAAATETNLAVRARPGPEPDQIVIAFPWRRRDAAEAFGNEVPPLLASLLTTRRSLDGLVRDAARRVRNVHPGPAPRVPDPAIPVISVTGTNGKTTIVRLLAHLVRTAGMNVAYSSTDGVYFNDRLVEAGDYSGFGGAGLALSQPGVDVAVLETARGGILLRGMGSMHNDVAVVTNISPDHLDLQGVRTLDQLAEVKASITRITRSQGWDVLNADDPRVLAMRRGIRGRPWLFSLDHEHPAIRSVLQERGRATTVIDGWLTVLSGATSQALVPLEEVPVTLAGISSHNIHNAMAAASAALGIGLPAEAVVAGLRSFVLDPERNPGRTNLFELEGRIVVVDYAHNEAGMSGLVETCRGLRPRGGEIWIAFSAAGDRSDSILHGMGYVAARGADHVAVTELRRYLRGRHLNDLLGRLRAGAVDGGASDVPSFPDEIRALEWMLDRSRPGDLVALTALGQREEIFALMDRRGAARVGATRVRELVKASRGRRQAPHRSAKVHRK